MLSWFNRKRYLTPLSILSAPWGMGARQDGCAQGPYILHQSGLLDRTILRPLYWQLPITTDEKNMLDQVKDVSSQLNCSVSTLIKRRKPFLVLGGDHTCALGTWPGALSSVKKPQKFGLLWIDAHMDSHTMETSHSHNIHGMPLAYLLGQGDPTLFFEKPLKTYLNPKRVCLMGVRSFEQEEYALLIQLGVRIFMMDEIKQRGFKSVFKEALSIVKKGHADYGLSIDMDGFDPAQAPGTGVRVPLGLDVNECCDMLVHLRYDKHFIGVEVAEYDPTCDRNQLTQQAIVRLIKSIYG